MQSNTSPVRSCIERHPYLLAVLLLFALQYFLGDHPALKSTVRYNESCAEMVESGDWIVPQLGGVAYLEKPILTYWLGAASMSVFGINDRAAHLASALCMAIVLCCMIAMARRWWGREAGGLALGVGIGSFLLLATSGMLTTDPVLSAAMACAWLAWGNVLETGHARHRWYFWVAVAVGWLAKGPVALALVASAILCSCLLRQGWRGIWQGLIAVRPWNGILVIAAINLPWSLAVWLRDPRLLEFFYFAINFGSLAASEGNHPEPVWFYLQLVPLMVMPWGLVGLVWFARSWYRGLRERPRVSVPEEPLPTVDTDRIWRHWMSCCAIGPLVFLSLVSSKLPSYLLPMLPCYLLLMIDGLRAVTDWRRWRWFIVGQSVLFVLALPIALMASKYWPQLRDGGLLPLVALCLLPLLLAWLAWPALLWRGRPQTAVLFVSGGMALSLALALPQAERLAPQRFPGPLATIIEAQRGPDDLVILDDSVVHNYHFDQRLSQRPLIYGSCRERGMGHWIESRPPSEGMPHDADGQALYAYRVNGELLPDNPHLIDDQRLLAAWKDPDRVVWLLASGKPPALLRDAHVDVHVWDRIGSYRLYVNRPAEQVAP